MLTAIPKEITQLTLLDITSSAAGNYLDCSHQAEVIKNICGEQQSLQITTQFFHLSTKKHSLISNTQDAHLTNAKKEGKAQACATW